MTADNRTIEKLRKAYDMMTPGQLDEQLDNVEGYEIDGLSEESRQRIRSMISERINRADTAPAAGRSKASLIRRAVAAAVVLVFVSVAALNAEAVMAAVARLFGFVPGVGIIDVDSTDTRPKELYILADNGTTYENDMLEIEIKGIFVNGSDMELRYTVYLNKITDDDLAVSYNDVSGLYHRYGYDKYFSIAEESPLLTPYTVTTLDGEEITPKRITVTETESMESVRTVCITHRYDLTGREVSESPCGTLSVGDAQVSFSLKKLALDPSVQEASGGQLAEVDGVKLLCVPTRRDNTLYLDYYACELGEYKATTGFRGWFITDTLTVGGTVIEDVMDESCIFFSEDTNHVGNRLRYDLSDAPDADEAVIEAFGLFVTKEYDGEGVTLDAPPAAEQPLNEAFTLDGIEFRVVAMSHRNYGLDEGFDELEYGYLEFRYSAAGSDDLRCFINLDEVSINGETAEYFCIEPYDAEYESIIVPLSIPYSEVRTIGFDSITLMLQQDITITVPLKAE